MATLIVNPDNTRMRRVESHQPFLADLDEMRKYGVKAFVLSWLIAHFDHSGENMRDFHWTKLGEETEVLNCQGFYEWDERFTLSYVALTIDGFLIAVMQDANDDEVKYQIN